MKKNRYQTPQKRRRPERQAVSYLDELKSEIATFFEINNEDAFSLQAILDHFDAHDKKRRLLIDGILQELHDEERIARRLDGQYKFQQQTANLLTGKVEHVNKAYAFVVLDGQDDVWIDADDLNGALDGDLVQVTIFSDSRRKRRKEGRVEVILERGRTEFVGTIAFFVNHGVVYLDNRRMYEDVYISESKTKGAEAGDKVLIKVLAYATRTKRMEGEVVDVLGKVGDNNTEMHAILAEFGLPYRFSESLEKAANDIPETITEEEIARRRDMRPVLTFTIDPADAKDFDDAISFQVLENGNYEIGVHIADVSHYVQPNTELEQEAYYRATSVYLVDRTVPMLPEKLSNNLCSLRPNEDKLTFSAIFEMDENASLKKEWFGRTVIHSDKRFSYEDAQEVLDSDELRIKNEELRMKNSLFSLSIINALAKKLREERFRKGAINFETVEVKFKLDENGKPLGVYQKIRKDSHKLIEEFMLLANKRVAEFVVSKSKLKTKPNLMVYRVHEEPNIEKLRTFATFATRFGYKMKVENESQAAQSLNELLAQVEGKPEQNVLEQLAVRTMAKARYTTEDLGHFGLAFRRYSHFTSPIRRYPDVMAHRLLQHYIDEKPSPDVAWFEAACKHSSEREKLATEAERASIKYKQVEFMASMSPDKIWDGIITGVTDFGIFVEISETSCEGMVRMGDLNDDFYEWDKENYRVVGQRTKKIYAFGDAVKVRVKETNISRRSMDLWLESGNKNVRSEKKYERKKVERGHDKGRRRKK